MKWTVLCAVLVAFIGWIFVVKGTNNVCKTFGDYYTDRDSNENCYYNPDGELEVPEIVKRHGYPIETHEVTTEDGYILSLFRIPHGKKLDKEKRIRKPVLLNHCFFANSAIYVYLGKKSLAFILADAGYDVWLGNLRGSKYSRKHSQLNETDLEYWDYSFHEIGVYDLPAQINFITGVVKQKVIHLGYLMSTPASFIYGVVHPEAALKNVKTFINFSPAVFLPKSDLSFKLMQIIWPILEMLQFNALTGGRMFLMQPLPTTLHKFLCHPFPFQMKACQFFEHWFLGYNFDQMDPETLPVTMQQVSDAGSVKTMAHFVQLVSSGNFNHFDYGVEENKKRYGTPEPPPYDLSKFKVPAYLIAAENDQFVTPKNVELLYNALPTEAKVHGIYTIKNKKFNHFDYVKAKDVVSLLYEPVVKFINGL